METYAIEIGARFDDFFSGSAVAQGGGDAGRYSNDPAEQAGAELLSRQYAAAKRNRFFTRVTDLDVYAVSVLLDYAETDVEICDDNLGDAFSGDDRAMYRAERKSAAKTRDRCAAILQDAGWISTRDSYGFATWRPPTQGA